MRLIRIRMYSRIWGIQVLTGDFSELLKHYTGRIFITNLAYLRIQIKMILRKLISNLQRNIILMLIKQKMQKKSSTKSTKLMRLWEMIIREGCMIKQE